MIPQPEVLRFEVRHGQHVRVVICSDGVWDLVTLSEAAALARRAPSAHDAARRIADKARTRSLSKFDRLKDDTTCVVVDLNPSRQPVSPPDGGAGPGGCCAVS